MKYIIRSFLLMLTFTIVLGLVYPFFTFLTGNLFFKNKAQGSFIEKEGKIVGSALIGQKFVSEKYFHSRPSFNDYDGMKSGSCSKGVFSSEYLEKIQRKAEDYRKVNGVYKESLPVDAVTESASGLDPHISKKNAYLQSERVAKSRDIPLEKIKSLIDTIEEKPSFYVLGNSRVNVLKLNLALDRLSNE